MIPLHRWQEAQAAEAAYWHHADRAEEGRRAAWYAGMLQLVPGCASHRRVLEVASGPQGLLLNPAWNVAHGIALDPLTFDRRDEAAYIEADIERVQQPAEEYAAPAVDEVWGANVLQHVMDPAAVLAMAQTAAMRCVRWFDWVNTPVTTVHPHSIRADWLDQQFRDWRCVWRVDGQAVGAWGAQAFAARVWERS